MSRNGVDQKEKSVRTPRVALLYCLECHHQFLVQTFDQFCDETGTVSLELPKGAKHK